jgi:hypothetical protein
MTATTLASSSDVAATASLRAASILPDPLAEKYLGMSLLRELTASWQSASHVVERRREHRFPCNLAALLEPVDGEGQALDGPKLRVRLKDIARHGVGIVHHEPVPYRVVLLSFETADHQTIRLLARLQWCRFKKSGVYESGGQIVRILQADESLQSLCTFPDEPPEAATRESRAADRPTEPERTAD